jgi:hypothetical protein
LGAWLLVCSPSQAETNAARLAAWKGLKTFTSLVTTQDLGQFGFNSTNEFAQMQLAEPFPIYDLSLRALRAWHPTQDLRTLFVKPETMLFPVTVTQDVRVSISVQKAAGQWKAKEFGGGGFARLYAGERQKSAQITHFPLSAYFAVRAPALNAHLIGYSETNRFMLISVLNDPESRFEASKPVLAEEALQRLARAARRYRPAPQ